MSLGALGVSAMSKPVLLVVKATKPRMNYKFKRGDVMYQDNTNTSLYIDSYQGGNVYAKK